MEYRHHPPPPTPIIYKFQHFGFIDWQGASNKSLAVVWWELSNFKTHELGCPIHLAWDLRLKVSCQIPDSVVLDCTSRYSAQTLTRWGRGTHLCLNSVTIVGSDNGLSPCRCQAIIWTNAGTLFIVPPGTNVSEILIEIYTLSFKKMYLKMSSAKWRPFGLGLNVSITLCDAIPM